MQFIHWFNVNLYTFDLIIKHNAKCENMGYGWCADIKISGDPLLWTERYSGIVKSKWFVECLFGCIYKLEIPINSCLNQIPIKQVLSTNLESELQLGRAL